MDSDWRTVEVEEEVLQQHAGVHVLLQRKLIVDGGQGGDGDTACAGSRRAGMGRHKVSRLAMFRAAQWMLRS